MLVLLPYRFTLFSNPAPRVVAIPAVLLPYRFTLFSNEYLATTKSRKFYYLIDLHYSQTKVTIISCGFGFTTL
nr:MAG TPA: hypothetical protein [Bacteriophage sp.]